MRGPAALMGFAVLLGGEDGVGGCLVGLLRWRELCVSGSLSLE